ncbi:PREDICTED: uncharacterized protein LOC105147687 [Acromyrmex echinatior]|nr:PREDICTED: uncharacterized protein LOC105147687 [Acromyrmex echinatior]
MADQQLKDNKIRVFNVRVRQYLRKHFIPSKVEYFTNCKYCLSRISYRSIYSLLLEHLTMYHPQVLTEEQKTERNIHWAWDYFTQTSSGDAQCNICSKILKGCRIDNLTTHLDLHRDKHKIFDPDEVIYEDTYMFGASTSTSGSMIEVAEYQETTIASNLTDDTDRTRVPNE